MKDYTTDDARAYVEQLTRELEIVCKAIVPDTVPVPLVDDISFDDPNRWIGNLMTISARFSILQTKLEYHGYAVPFVAISQVVATYLMDAYITLFDIEEPDSQILTGILKANTLTEMVSNLKLV